MQTKPRLALLALAFALAGCSGTADALGLGRNAPDEFAVVDRPPLSMPPDFDLRPPKPGAPRPQEIKTTDRASQTLFGTSSKSAFLAGGSSSTSASDSEKGILEAAGAAKADPNIRQTIDRETTQRVVGSKQLIDDILWWRKNEQGTTVDAAAEAQRLKEAKEKGESVTNGATPVIEKNKSGWLGL